MMFEIVLKSNIAIIFMLISIKIYINIYSEYSQYNINKIHLVDFTGSKFDIIFYAIDYYKLY